MRKYSKIDKRQRIIWLGHLERMEEDRMPKKIFTQELEGTRRRGRPRKGWKEEAERDLQVLGVRRWRELVTDKKKVEGHCSTGQSPQWAVVPMEEEDVRLLEVNPLFILWKVTFFVLENGTRVTMILSTSGLKAALTVLYVNTVCSLSH